MTIENNDQKKANSRFSHVKQFIALFDNIQGRILALAMTVSVVFGIVNNFTPLDQKKNETLSKGAEYGGGREEGEKSPTKPAKPADQSIMEEEPKGNPAKDEDIVIPKTENPKSDIAEQQPKPNKPAQSEKPVKKSESKKKTATEPAIPAESAVKPMTAEERKKLEEEMNKVKEELDERRKAEDPDDKLSNVKEDKRKKIKEDEENFRKKMEKVFNNQSE